MNTEWEFLRDFWFYNLLGLVCVVPLAILVSAFNSLSYSQALSKTRSFLKRWASFGNDEVWHLITMRTAKTGGVIVLLALFAWGLNRLGDKTIPYASMALFNLGNQRVAWSLQFDEEWDELRYKYREAKGIKDDLFKWERAKARLGSYSYRFFRTLFLLGLLISFSGVLRVRQRSQWRSGAYELSFGLALALLATALWVESNNRFIRNMISEYREVQVNKTGQEPVLPKHYPGPKQ